MVEKIRFLDKIKIFQKVLLKDGEGRLLVLKRSEENQTRQGCWDFPGGNFEKGEDIVKAAEREVREETKLEVDRLIPIYVESSGGRRNDGVDVIAIAYLSTEFSGEIGLSNEHDEYRWVKLEEFLEMDTGEDGGFLKASVRAYLDRYANK